MQLVGQTRQTHSIAKVSPCQVISPAEWWQVGARHEWELGVAIELRVGLFFGWSNVCSGRSGHSEDLVPRSDARAGGATEEGSVHVRGRRRRTCGGDRETETECENVMHVVRYLPVPARRAVLFRRSRSTYACLMGIKCS